MTNLELKLLNIDLERAQLIHARAARHYARSAALGGGGKGAASQEEVEDALTDMLLAELEVRAAHARLEGTV